MIRNLCMLTDSTTAAAALKGLGSCIVLLSKWSIVIGSSEPPDEADVNHKAAEIQL